MMNIRIQRRHFLLRGIGLVELMVALVSGILLTAGIVQIYISNKQTYRAQDELARLQENGRYAMHLLVSDLRSAGYMGCASLDFLTPNTIADNPPPTTFNSSGAITGHEYTGGAWDPVLPANVTSALPNTDVVTVQHSDDCGAYLTGNMVVTNANVQLYENNSCNYQAGEALLISDCEAADLFRATNVSNGSGTQTIAHLSSNNTSNNLSKSYGPDAQIMRFVSDSYFVRNGANGDPALWRLDNTTAVGANNPVELVEGVVDLQIRYGIDSDADGVANTYQTADTVTTAGTWNQANSVRIFLLLRTIKQVAAQPQDYSFMGTTTTPADRFLRREFSTTIRLRNRGLS